MTDRRATDADTLRKRVRRYAGLFFVLGAFQLGWGIAASIFPGIASFDLMLGLFMSGTFFTTASVMAWNGSRFAVLAISYWLILELVMLYQAGWQDNMAGIVRGLAFAVLALMLNIHAFRHWPVARRSERGRVRGRAWTRWVGLLIICSVLALGILGATGYGSEEDVTGSLGIIAGTDLPAEHLAWMRSQQLLHRDETVLIFYSSSDDIAADGNILTDKYLGSWWQDEDGELASDWVRLGAVCDVTKTGEEYGVAIYDVSRADGADALVLWLPSGQALSTTFIQRLDYLRTHHTNDAFEDACETGEPVDWEAVSRANGIPVGVINGDEIDAPLRQWLLGQDFLVPHEEAIWLRSTALYDISEGGTLMTDAYFGGWEAPRGELQTAWVEHGEICEIALVEEDEEGGELVYRATGPEAESWVQFTLPASDPASVRRVEELRALTESNRTTEHAEACDAVAAQSAASETSLGASEET